LKYFSLSYKHFASGWNVEDNTYNDTKTVNELAISYSTATDESIKSDLGQQLLKCFHSYFMKYTGMVVTGQIPSLKTPAGRDAAKMLRMLIPEQQKDNYLALSAACKTLHLAFKQQTPDDIYNVMIFCFMKACNKYDPTYHTKIKDVCLYLKSIKKKKFDIESINQNFDYDVRRVLRWLWRKKILNAIKDQKNIISAYEKGAEWPPSEKLFHSGPIGFTYFAPSWFKYYLNEYISDTMSQIETKENVLQLEHASASFNDEDYSISKDGAIQNIDGNYTDRNGVTRSADLSLMTHPLDISLMNDAWVNETNDKLFIHLKKSDRWLLKMIYVDELNWTEIAKVLQCTTNTAKSKFNTIIKSIQRKL
jgi:hypothetical protein